MTCTTLLKNRLKSADTYISRKQSKAKRQKPELVLALPLEGEAWNMFDILKLKQGVTLYFGGHIYLLSYLHEFQKRFHTFYQWKVLTFGAPGKVTRVVINSGKVYQKKKEINRGKYLWKYVRKIPPYLYMWCSFQDPIWSVTPTFWKNQGKFYLWAIKNNRYLW